jgi:ribose transport system permease protein
MHITPTSSSSTSVPLQAPKGAAIAGFILDNLVWFVLVIVLAGFSLTIPNFFQIGILLNIFEQSTFVGIMAVGLSLVIIAGEMDLSIESTMALSAMVTAVLFGTNGAGLQFTFSPSWLNLPVSLLISIAVGAVVGASNAWLIVGLKINSFIVTLASFIWVRGLVVALSGGRSVYGLPAEIRGVAIASVGGVPLLVWITVLVFAVFAFILTKTPLGRHIVMVGGNATAAFRAGIRVRQLMATTIILSGCIAGFAGWLLASRTAGATANLGTGMLFEVFAAVVIGGVSLKGGVGRLSGVFAGVLLLSSISTAINVMGMPPHYTLVIRGALVLAAILLDTMKTSLRRRLT